MDLNEEAKVVFTCEEKWSQARKGQEAVVLEGTLTSNTLILAIEKGLN